MPRPTGPCARCIRHMLPDCQHLAHTYDKYVLKTRGRLDDLDEQESMKVLQELAEYGLNRMLALDKDNKNKATGTPASRVYHSRNTRASEALALKCHVRHGSYQCMRNAGHDGDHRF